MSTHQCQQRIAALPSTSEGDAMKIQACVACLALAAGCSSSSVGTTPDGGSSSGTASGGGVKLTNNGCALPPSGVFRVHYTETPSGGNCGPIPDSLFSGDDVVKPSCNDGSIIDEPINGGGCKVTANVKGCVGDGTVSAFLETMTWNADYSAAAGTWQVDITSGSQSCHEVYDVTFTKQ